MSMIIFRTFWFPGKLSGFFLHVKVSKFPPSILTMISVIPDGFVESANQELL